jgi:alpha-tubulin suppressor-like RCC1 family protein
MGNIQQISTGLYHSLLLNNQNQLFSMGSNQLGQLGLGISLSSNIFIPSLVNITEKIIQISCGYYHNLILVSNGDVYTFGANDVKI